METAPEKFVGIETPVVESPEKVLREVRCFACRRLLCKSDGRGIVEVRCPRCFNVTKG